MRSALLSAIERTEEGNLRAFERLGGRSLIEWQVDMARDLGAERIICLAESDSEPLQALRRRVEGQGLEFHLVRGPLPLVSLLSADQELVVIADGLVVDRKRLYAAMGQRRGVAAFPAPAGLAAGFERIDAEHAWGGILVARARIAEQLAEMPPDSNTISVLLRLALQSGAKLIALDDAPLSTGEWLLVENRESLDRRENALLDLGIERAGWAAPGTAMGQRIARWLAPGALARGPEIALSLGGLALACALAMAHFAWPLAALGALVAALVLLRTGEALSSLRVRLSGEGRPDGAGRWAHYALDLGLWAVLALPLEEAGTAAGRMFLPTMLIGLLWLGESLAPPRWRGLWRDRLPVLVVLLPTAWLGLLDQATAGLCLLTLACCLFFRRKTKITRA